ncbi:MAG: cyclic nucleotide-binding domain-containing protein [Kiritimatiellae bacterium]|nr:cyclic nucleotide-binding domain-containing protein [Kiritimatiellia bacterium]
MQVLKKMEWERIRHALDKLAFFEGFSPQAKRRLLDNHAELVVCAAGEHVVEKGGSGSSFYILLSGTVSVVVEEGTPPVAKMKPGESFGEIAFLTDTPRNATVVADENVILIRIDRTMFTAMTPELREKFKDQFIRKLVATITRMNRAFSDQSR